MTKYLSIIIYVVFSSFMIHGCESFSAQKADLSALPILSNTPNASDREENEWWRDRHQGKKQDAKSQKIDVLMIGDSITHSWEKVGLSVWNKYYQSRNGFNIGIGGDLTEHVLWRLQNGAVDNMQPKVAVLMIGTNNTGHRMDPADHTAMGIESIIKSLRQRLPISYIDSNGVPETKAHAQRNLEASRNQLEGLIPHSFETDYRSLVSKLKNLF